MRLIRERNFHFSTGPNNNREHYGGAFGALQKRHKALIPLRANELTMKPVYNATE